MENTDWDNEEIPMRDLPTRDENYEYDDPFNDDDEAQETSFNDDDENYEYDDIIPNVGQDVGTIRRSITRDKKDFLRNHLGIFINKGDGPKSKELFDSITITLDKRSEISGMDFNGRKIVVWKNDKFVYSDAIANRKLVAQFKDLVQKAEREHFDTVESLVEREIESPSDDLTKSIIENTSESIDEYIDEQRQSLSSQVGRLTLTDVELREINAILEGGINRQNISDKERMGLLDGEIEHYTKLAKDETDSRKSRFFKSIARVATLEKDSIRMKMGLKPESDIVSEILDEEVSTNDLSRFERFKDWVKRNFGAIAGVVIGLGGIVTSVVVGVRGAIKSGAKVVGDFAKGLAKITKEVGPLAGAILGLVANVLGFTAKAVTWLSKNLWLLIVLLVVYLLDKYGKNK